MGALALRDHWHEPELDVILTHMYLWSSESDPDRLAGRREVPLNPRHAASFDLLGEIGPARIGFEVFVTGRQALEDDPYSSVARPAMGALLDWNLGRARVFVNAENLGKMRQTFKAPLVRRSRAVDGRWTVDVRAARRPDAERRNRLPF